MVAVIGFIMFIILFLAPIILYLNFGWFHRWFHDLLDWHQPDSSPQWSDGCSIHCKCKWCGQDIMQDSQGNWFAYYYDK